MHFDVLGPLRVTRSAGRVVVPAGRSSAALCWLILNANHAVTAESLVPVLWPGSREAPAARARMVVRSLVPLLDPGTLEVADHLRLVVSDDAVDARRFERLVNEARRHLQDVSDGAGRAEANLREALGLWRGEACPELDRALPAQARIDQLTELRLRAQEDLNAIVLRAEVDYLAVADLRAQTVLHGDRPRLRRQLAFALYRTGRQVEALDVLRQLRELFGDSDGLAAQLQSAMLRHDEQLAAGMYPVL